MVILDWWRSYWRETAMDDQCGDHLVPSLVVNDRMVDWTTGVTCPRLVDSRRSYQCYDYMSAAARTACLS